MKGSVKLPVFIDDARKYVNSAQLRAKYLGANYEAEYCQWQTLHGLGELMQTASLIITPSAYQEGKLLSTWPPDGSGDLSVTRATTATRVNSAGLVELVPYNLVQYSEQFDNGYWNKLGSTIGANSVVAPNGTTTADKVIETSTTADHYVTRASNFTQGLTYTISVYAKAGERNWLAIGFNNEAQRLAWFNLSTGVVGTVLSSVTATSIESVGNGWYRCSATMTAATNLPYPSIMIAPSDGVKNYLGNGTNGLFIWGAQLVEGTQAKDYFATETRLNISRLDYSLGSCPSILLEPQRTNILQRSEEFNNVVWTKTNASVTANTTISPDGLQDADKLVENTALGQHALLVSGGWSTTQQTASIYVKSAERTKLYIGNNSLGVGIFFDLTTGTIEGILGAINGTISSVGSGWYRVTATHTAAAAQTLLIGTYITYTGVYSTTKDYTGNGTSGIYLWGAQLEAGAYPTSYIPTTSASVTRNADVISKTGISSLIGQSEGTIFYEFAAPIVEDITRAISLSGSSVSNRINISTYSNSIFVRVDVGGANQVNSSAVISVTNMNKIAFRYKANDFSLYVNGVNVITDTSGITFPAATLDRISNLQPDGTFPYNGNIKAIALWKTGLTNAELATLTTI